MFIFTLHDVLVTIQHTVSFFGILIILIGILSALFQYIALILKSGFKKDNSHVNIIRLELARTLLLGLEFIVAADLIGTTTAPDYYSVGILGIIVLVRTMLSFTLNRELNAIGKK
jgi:uncharacterized membrane protein